MTCLCGSPSIRDMGSVAVRPAVVAGKFYPSQAPILRRDLENYLGTGFESAEKVEGALGCVVPHAGYMFRDMWPERCFASFLRVPPT